MRETRRLADDGPEVSLRLLIIGDPRLLMTRVPLESFVSACAEHPGVELLGLCDAGRSDRSRFFARVRDAARTSARRIFNDVPSRPVPGPGIMHDVGRRWRVPVLTPAGRDVNSPEFLDELRERRLNAVLSLGCLQIFGAEFLSIFPTAVNFHNGLLPSHRGLSATAWSFYNGEAETGYSFHRITAGIDEGDVIFEGKQPIVPGLTTDEADWNKCVAAAAAAGDVIAAMADGSPGRAQGQGTYHSLHDWRRICRIERPQDLPVDEIRRRLRCFGLLRVKIEGRWWEVTEVADEGTPSIRTADGRLGVKRAMFLPPWLYRAYRALS